MALPRRRAAFAFAMGALASLPAAASAGVPPPEFPAGFEAYHTYAEVVAELQAIEAAQPTDPAARIFQLSVAGQSYEGRDIWVAKISDQVAIDEDEPEVLMTALTHANEHLTVEQALAFIHWLVDGHGSDPRVTQIVDGTEIWVMPALNPDGGEFDISGGQFQAWRKNRQPTPDSIEIGTDINRNYGYRWGCCGDASPDPVSRTFRGPSKFSTPEARVERHFIRGRVVGGTQQLVLALSLHTWGELIVFPYGYTRQAHPPDMDAQDRQILKTMAQAMAATNGYDVIQGGRWYVTSGTFGDWAYARHGILPHLMELAPDTPEEGGPYLPADQIPVETERNREALLWYVEQAACPSAVIGISCGTSAGRSRYSLPL